MFGGGGGGLLIVGIEGGSLLGRCVVAPSLFVEVAPLLFVAWWLPAWCWWWPPLLFGGDDLSVS